MPERAYRDTQRPGGAAATALFAAGLLVLGLVPTAAAAQPDAPPSEPGHDEPEDRDKPDKPGKPGKPGKPERDRCDKGANDSYEKLLRCVSADSALEHLEAFQEIADANDGNRTAGTPGYDASADYVVEQLTEAGYEVDVQPFEFAYFEETATPGLSYTTNDGDVVDLVEEEDFLTMTFSGAGDVTASATAVPVPDDPDQGAGCTTEDFADFPDGDVALVQRGVCPFADKATNAEEAGASSVVIYNTPGEPVLAGTLGGPGVGIPAVGTSHDVGLDLVEDADEVSVLVEAFAETRETVNVFAETTGGRDDNVVMVGAHLDSIGGPGINDNGSGSAALIEVAEQMRKVDPENQVRFAWWGAEEFGLLGSYEYVDQLSEEEREDIALYLNFDMIASPNYVRFVYDGDGSAFGLEGPEGSAAIEALYEDFYASRDLAWEPTEISFRSDYAAFFDVDIPFGGLFTGAEGIKTAEEVEIYGGVEGEQYDPCYHEACDDLSNLDLEVYDLNIDAVAYSTLTYAFSTETVNGEVGQDVPGDRKGKKGRHDVDGARHDAPAGAGIGSGSGGHAHEDHEPAAS